MAVRRGVAALILACVVLPVPVMARQDGARAKDLYRRAVDLQNAGNDAAALALLWQAAGLAPRDSDIQNRLGDALAQMGAFEAAIGAFERALSERPDFQKAANSLVLTLVQAGRSADAVVRARAFIARAPDDPDRYFTLGLAQSEQDVEAAMATFRQVLRLAPRHTLARYNLALVLQRADRLREAIEELERAIALEPRAEVYYSLGVSCWHRGDLDRAVQSLQAATALDPRHAAAYHALGAVLKERQDWPGAASAFRRAIALQPDAPAARVALARVMQLSGDEAGARVQLDEGERLRRQSQQQHEALVWTAVGTAKLDAGDALGALDDFRRATATFDRYAPAHYQMGRALERLGERDASRAAFERARQLNPSLISSGK
jgi:tetratricopeptide (TPR) repeat protein